MFKVIFVEIEPKQTIHSKQSDFCLNSDRVTLIHDATQTVIN